MKKIFTLVAAAMMAVCANAQTTEWNFSEWEAKEFKQAETKDGLTVYSGTDASGKAATVIIDANNKTWNDITYSQRLKLGGTGSFDETGTPCSRILAFDVNGDCKIEVLLTTSNKTDDRVLIVDMNANGTKTEVTKVPCTANEVDCKTIEYKGEAGTIYLYSESGGINIYDIKYTPESSTGIYDITKDNVDANAPVYNLAGQRVSKETKGILIQNGKKFINK